MFTRTMPKLATALLITSLVLANAVSAFAKNGADDDEESSGSSSSASSISSSSNSSRSSSRSSRSGSSVGNSRSSSASSRPSHQAKTNLRLSPLEGVETSARGRAEYKASAKKSERRLTVKVVIPEGSSVPPLADSNAVDTLNITARIARRAATLAECSLSPHSMSDDNSSVKAEFKLDVRSKRNRGLRSAKGSCSTSATSSTRGGLPELRRGDTLTIEESLVGSFLRATF